MANITLEEIEAELRRHQHHAVELRQRAARLRGEAEQARAHAVLAIQGVRMRREGQPPSEYAEFQAEQERGTRELAAYITALRNEQEELRGEVALQDQWFADQVVEMVEQGWTRAELAEIGFDDDLLDRLGLGHHPGLNGRTEVR